MRSLPVHNARQTGDNLHKGCYCGGMSDGDNGGGGEPNVGEEERMPAFPGFPFGPSIAHYYGDYVRQIFIVTAAIMLITAPFIIERAPVLLPFEIGGAIILAILAALTNPKKTWVLMADALVAGVGVLVFEILALGAYNAGSMIVFILLEAITLAFLFALYFSLKTLRAMMHGQIGKRPKYGEFVQ